MMPQFPSKQAPWDLTQFSQSPSVAPLYFPESYQQSEIPSLSKVILVLQKARSCRVPHLGCRVAESPGWFDVSPKNSAGDVMHERAHCGDEAANHQLPIAVAFWIIGIVSMEKCSSLTQNMMQIHCSTPSVILNVTSTHYTCSLKGIYRPHWLLRWSRHCSHMHIPVHSPSLPEYTDVVQTILLILTMAGLFLDRSCIANKHLVFKNIKVNYIKGVFWKFLCQFIHIDDFECWLPMKKHTAGHQWN